MRCANCGGELIDGKCVVCGDGKPKNTPPISNSRINQSSEYDEMTGQSVSIGRWLGRYFLTWIPFVGGLVYIIMLIVWACTDKFDKTSKNWAIATLIMTAINLAVSALIVCVVISIISAIINDPAVQNQLQHYMMF